MRLWDFHYIFLLLYNLKKHCKKIMKKIKKKESQKQLILVSYIYLAFLKKVIIL